MPSSLQFLNHNLKIYIFAIFFVLDTLMDEKQNGNLIIARQGRDGYSGRPNDPIWDEIPQ